MRRVGVLGLVCAVATAAHAGEVHTRGTVGTWYADQARGTLRASIPNDQGFSFWLMGDSISPSTPVTVIAQVRFLNRVDYGGAGIAIIDTNATNAVQKHIRIELSEREDTIGVGGWLGNENHFGSGGSKKTGRDIKVGEWYELAIKIDGTKVTGLLDRVEIFSGDIPEIRDFPQQLTVAPFVIEADVEIKVIVRASPPTTTQPVAASGAKIASIEPYGRDETDGSGVKWLAKLPTPSFADDPNGTKSNAEWDGSYDLKGDRVCVRIASLRSAYPPSHKVSLGYTVTLDGAIFDNGSRTKTLLVYSFTGTPSKPTAGFCETITIGGVPRDPVVAPVAKLPEKGRISDLLPAKSKKQAEIEKAFTQRIASVQSPEHYKELYANDDLILVVGKFHLLLEPISKQWHFYDRLHDSWEPTGVGPGDATFSVVKKQLKATKKRKARK